ncbi:hypothetical protein J2X63_002055 [Agromyces sp. 3263]|uniref:hypothetical protein n=1 Tax=Agromyces sp. 3263 TaxID=2817750 RepID=UPI002858DD61|nr:hypothetical protein [Agromyces sp. 3263]MDR6906369.1 hypothetical protein [Agromyces sp. 3263]
MTIPADHDLPSFVVPADPFEHRPRRHIAPGDGLRPRRLAAAPPESEAQRDPGEPARVERPGAAAPEAADIQRYYLCCMEPDGEFVEVIVAVSDAGRRRYFTTADGRRLTEVEEDYFDLLRESGARSMLELDDREMGELEAELRFVRSVRGRDPLLEIEPPDEPVEARRAEEDAEEDDAPAPVAAQPPGPVAAAVEAPFEPVAPPPPEPPVTDAAAPPHPVTETATLTDDDDDDAGDLPDWTIEEFEAVMMGSTTTYEQVAPEASAPTADEPQVAQDAIAQPLLDAVAQVSLAKGIAFVAHRGQVDRVGAAYIDHPGRVAERFDPIGDPIAAASAWLHEVLEGTVVTAQELLEAGVLPEIVEVVHLMTRTPDVADDEFHARIRRHPVARRVKLAAIDDNAAPWRTRRLDYETQVVLAERYRHARELLGEV